MLSWYKKIKSFVFRTIHSSPKVRPTVLTVPFDAVVMVLIFVSVVIVFAVTFNLPPDVMEILKKAEDVIVAVFTVEYALRFWTADLLYLKKRRPFKKGRSFKRGRPFKKGRSFKRWRFFARIRYVFSVSAIVDLLAILPSYLPYLLPEGMLGIRALRLIRLTRIFKVTQHSATLSAITAVIKDKAKDLLAVCFFMSLMVLFLSLLMYAAEHDAQPDKFENAISALWWAIETFTKSGTRGFYPVTTLGRIIGAVVSVLGICLIAIPTGIISSGLIEQIKKRGENKE